MQSNGYKVDKNFWLDAVEWMNCWQKFLNSLDWMDEHLKKIIIFERMQSNGWTAEENNYFLNDQNKISTILEQVPFHLYKNERLDHFLIWKLIDSKILKKTDTALKFIISRINKLKANLLLLWRNNSHSKWYCLHVYPAVLC